MRKLILWVSCVLLIIAGLFCTITKSTCISAIKCLDGVVVASDSLAISGSLVGNRETIKIKQLPNNVVICCASGFKMFQQLFDELESEVNHHRLSYESELSVESIANYIRRKVHARSQTDTHILVVGIDSSSSSSDPRIFEVLPGGSLVSHDYVVAGPASGNLYPLLLELCTKKSASTEVHTITSDNNNRKSSGNASSSRSSSDSNTCMIGTTEAFEIVNKILRAAGALDPRSGGPIKRFLLKRNGRLVSVKKSGDLKAILASSI